MRGPPKRTRIATRPRPGKVRIVGGSVRGSKLAVPDRDGVRPTPDRVRETLFNWLVAGIEGARCLDLYAGTGALGIEALSRGAASCTFVERDRDLAGAIEGNLARLGVSGGVVACANAERFLDNDAQPHDVAFLDPPFSAGGWETAAARLEANGWLAPLALIYIESPNEIGSPLVPSNWCMHREGYAGDVRFALYRRDAAAGHGS